MNNGDMRSTASILHVDLDAFFASVEQRDKPSLRGKPVVVGGVGPRGVVSTASYEARAFGIRSAMSTAEARKRCPNAAYLAGRFPAYSHASSLVMDTLREFSPLVQPLSFDEAYVDLAAVADRDVSSLDVVRHVGEDLRATIFERTGLTCSVGLASSKFMAKIASELNKPDGLFLVTPGTEVALLGPMSVRAIPGVGPATGERLQHLGITTIEDVRRLSAAELVELLGTSHGAGLYRLARGEDDRRVDNSQETKSVSTEDTFSEDLTSRGECDMHVARLARSVAKRLHAKGLSARTVSLKVRRHNFETLSRSITLPAPTDNARVITDVAQRLLSGLEIGAGVRLLGVGVSGLADWVQDELFADDRPPALDEESLDEVRPQRQASWRPGLDVEHEEHGVGWVWGAGRAGNRDIVTIRFESRFTPPGPVMSFDADDPALRPLDTVVS